MPDNQKSKIANSAWQQLKNMSELTTCLEKLFGEKIIKPAIKKYGEDVEILRQNGKLRVDKKTGIITTLGAASLPIKPNTF